MRRGLEIEARLVGKWVAVEPYLDEGGRRRWAAAESRAIGYGGDSVVSSATGLSRVRTVAGRKEIETGACDCSRIRRPGAGRPQLEETQLGLKEA